MKRPWWLTVVDCELEEGQCFPLALYSLARYKAPRGETVTLRTLTLPVPIPSRQKDPARRAWSVGLHFPQFMYERSLWGTNPSKLNFRWIPWRVVYHSDVY